MDLHWRRQGWGKGVGSGIVGDRREAQRVRRMTGNVQLQGIGEPLESPRGLGWEKLPGFNGGDLPYPNSGDMELEKATSSS